MYICTKNCFNYQISKLSWAGSKKLCGCRIFSASIKMFDVVIRGQFIIPLMVTFESVVFTTLADTGGKMKNATDIMMSGEIMTRMFLLFNIYIRKSLCSVTKHSSE